MDKPLSIWKYLSLIFLLQIQFAFVSFPDLVSVCHFPVKVLILLPRVPIIIQKWKILHGQQNFDKEYYLLTNLSQSGNICLRFVSFRFKLHLYPFQILFQFAVFLKKFCFCSFIFREQFHYTLLGFNTAEI